jgi:hypothetical protein
MNRNTKVQWSDCVWRPAERYVDVSVPAEPQPYRVVSVQEVKGALRYLTGSEAPSPALRELAAAALATIVRLETEKQQAQFKLALGITPDRLESALEMLDRTEQVQVRE